MQTFINFFDKKHKFEEEETFFFQQIQGFPAKKQEQLEKSIKEKQVFSKMLCCSIAIMQLWKSSKNMLKGVHF